MENIDNFDLIIEERSIIAEKVLFLSKYKNELVSCLPSISYLLFKVLISDKSLTEIDEYNVIMDYIKNNKISSKLENCDEKNIITVISSISDKIATSFEEKESIRNYLSKYDDFFEKGKVKTKLRSA